MAGELRSATFTISVNGSETGTSIVAITRSVEQLASAEEALNRTAATNTTVTRTQNTTQREANATARLAIREYNNQQAAIARVVTDLNNQNRMTRMSSAQQQIFNAQLRAGVDPLSVQGRQIASLVTRHQQLVAASNSTQGSFRNLRGQAQNVGWQMQDVAVQMQAGTDGLVILSQQGSQLASGFGPAGALVGAFIAVGGALAGVLFKSLGSATSAISKLDKAQAQLDKTMKLSKEGVAEYSEEMSKLSDISEQIAASKLTAAITQQKAALKETVEVLQNSMGSVSSFFAIDKVNEFYGDWASNNISAVGSFNEVKDALENFDASKPQASIEWLGKALERAGEQGLGTTESGAELINMVGDLIVRFKDGQLSLSELEKEMTSLNFAQADTIKETAKLAEAVEDSIKSWQAKIDTVGKTEEAIALYNLTMEATTTAEKEAVGITSLLIKSYYEKLAVVEKEEDAQKAREKLAKEYASAELKRHNAVLNSFKSEYLAVTKQTETIEGEYSRRKVIIESYVNEMGSVDSRAADAYVLLESWKTTELKKEADKRIALDEKVIANQIASQKTFNKSLTQIYKASKSENVYEIEAEATRVAISKMNEIREQNQLDLEQDLITKEELQARELQADATFNQSKISAETARLKAQKALLDANTNMQVSSASQLANTLAGAAEEGSAAYKALFLIQQGFAITQGTMKAFSDAQTASSNVMQASVPVYGLGGADVQAKAAAAYGTTLALGMANVGATAGVAFAGAFDKGGTIPSGQAGIVSEFGDELVGGTMVYNNSSSGLGVTGREDTAALMSGSGSQTNTIVQNITVSGNGDAALKTAMQAAAKQGAEQGYKLVATDLKNNRGVSQYTARRSR